MISIDCLEEKGFTNISILKEAGQKVVFKGYSSQYGDVVIKIIKPNQNLLRIKREIEIVKGLDGISGSTIYENDTLECDNEEYLYIIENYISGGSLRDKLDLEGSLSEVEVKKFLENIIDTMVILEDNQLVHRDIKPENIMIDENGEFILIDYGIARDLSQTSLTATSSPRGPATTIYAPIEQIDNNKDEIDSRVDLYSTCLVAYEMLCGCNPFTQGCVNELQVIRKIDRGSFDFLSEDNFDIKLLEFIHTNMNRFRTRRCSSAKEAQEWIEEIL